MAAGNSARSMARTIEPAGVAMASSPVGARVRRRFFAPKVSVSVA